jgi:hypothetical protein
MNFAELDDEEDAVHKILMMDTYERLLRLRNVLEAEPVEPEAPDDDLLERLQTLRGEYQELVREILVEYEKLDAKKQKAGTLLSFIDKFGDKDYKYAEQMRDLVAQFDHDEGLTELAESVRGKLKRLLGMKRIFEICTDCDVASKYMCFLCIDRTIDTCIDPCGHSLCSPCSQKTRGICPFCRSPVHRFQKMFI